MKSSSSSATIYTLSSACVEVYLSYTCVPTDHTPRYMGTYSLNTDFKQQFLIGIFLSNSL